MKVVSVSKQRYYERRHAYFPKEEAGLCTRPASGGWFRQLLSECTRSLTDKRETWALSGFVEGGDMAELKEYGDNITAISIKPIF